MVEPASVALKFAFLAILYLFLLWIARSAMRDLRRPVTGGPIPPAVAASAAPPADATGLHAAARRPSARTSTPRLIAEQVSGHQPGSSYALTDDVTIGRGDVEISLEDTFASTRHARITVQGTAIVLEDLGSTNGTFLNEEPVDSPRPLHSGDRVRIGESTFVVDEGR